MVRCSLGIAFCGAATAYYFDGVGQLRAFQPVASTPPTGDIGCLTDAGLWTDIESECGNFTSVRNYGTTPNTLSISSSKGPCGILDNSTFVCGTSGAADTHLFTAAHWLDFVDVLDWGDVNVTVASAHSPGDPKPPWFIIIWRQL